MPGTKAAPGDDSLLISAISASTGVALARLLPPFSQLVGPLQPFSCCIYATAAAPSWELLFDDPVAAAAAAAAAAAGPAAG